MKLRDVVLLLVTVFLFISCGSSHEEHTHGDAHDHIHAVHTDSDGHTHDDEEHDHHDDKSIDDHDHDDDDGGK